MGVIRQEGRGESPARPTELNPFPWLPAFENSIQERYALGTVLFDPEKARVVDTAPGPRIGAEAYAQIDPEEYLNRAVTMFHGVEETVTLVCDNEISNVVFDLWPEAKQKTRRVDDDHFRVKFNIYVSNQFFAQLCGLGGHVRIKSPNDIRKQYIAFLKENIYNQRIRRKNLVEKEGTGEIIED